MALNTALFKALSPRLGRQAAIRLANPNDVWGLVPNYTGSASTRSAVRTQLGGVAAIGSVYRSTAGKAYLKVANAGANTDWERITTSAVD